MKPGRARARVARRRGNAGKEGAGGGGKLNWVEYASSRLPILEAVSKVRFQVCISGFTSFTLSTSFTSPTKLDRWKQ